MKKLVTLLFLSAMLKLNAQEAQLLKDIATGGESTFKYDAEINSYTVNNQMYFYFDHEKYGAELWRTNGTEVGTQLVKDISPGIYSSNPRFIGSFDNTLLFNASIRDSGSFLFTTTGSASGTNPLLDKDGNPVFQASDPVMVNDVLYFYSIGDLYRTQGTPESTYRLVDFQVHNINYIRGLVAVADLFFFMAYNHESGYEPWVSDGTTNGTRLLKDINPGLASSDVIGGLSITAGADQIYFLAEDAVHGKELWKSDGTSEGTSLLKDLTSGPEGSTISYLGVVNDVLYFTYRKSNIERDLWKTDGTAEGTVKLEDELRGNTPIMFKGELFFRGDGRLWKANGSSEVQLTDHFVEPSFAITDDWLYYLVSSNDGIGLWRTDGSEDGEEFIKNLTDRSYYDVENLISAGENIFFTCETDSFGIELCASDGTAEGTQIMVDSRPGPEDGFESYRDVKFGFVGENLIFAGYSEEQGRELWISDATPEGTRLLRDLTPRTNNVRLSGLPVAFKGSSYFLADTGFWKTDGTPEGTMMIKGFQGSNHGGLRVFNNQLVFSAEYPELGRTLWTSDGTPEGTTLVFDTSNNKTIRILMNQENPVFNGEIYFRGLNEFGYELWKTDGTVEGTYMVKDIYEGNIQSSIELNKESTVVLNGNLFFGAANEALGFELWKTDGTEEGTVAVTDINPQGNATVSNMTLLNNLILFTADDGSSGKELWSTDGTIDGTMMIKDIYPGEKHGIPYSTFIKYKDHIYFQGENQEFGRELWRTDGTEEGTELFLDLYLNDKWSSPSDFQVIEDYLYFLARTEEGKKLFRTNGTVEGTSQVMDATVGSTYLHADGNIFYDNYTDSTGNQLWRLAPGKTEPVLVKGTPEGFYAGNTRLQNYVNNTLFFKGSDDLHGEELWALLPLEASVSIEMNDEEICSTGDTLTLRAVAMHAGEKPVFTWHVNGVAVSGENSDKISLTGLNDGDEVKLSVETDNQLWLTNYNPESEIYTVSYQNPVAEITVNQSTLNASQGTSYIWYLDEVPLTDTTQTITATVSGTYTVEVFNAAGCSSLSNPVALVINPTSVEVLSGGMDVKVFPNPATDYMKIQSATDVDLQLHILALNGMLLHTNQIQLSAGVPAELPVDFLEKGMYLIKGVSEKGSFVQTFVIQ